MLKPFLCASLLTAACITNSHASSVFLQDSFAGAAQGSLTAHVGEQAHWSQVPNMTGVLQLNGNGQVAAVADANSACMAAEVPGSFNNIDLQATFTAVNSHRSYPGIGLKNANGDWLVAMYDSYYQSWDLIFNNQIVAFSGANSASLSPGHGYVVKLSSRPGGIYTLSVDGVTTAQATVSTMVADHVTLSDYGQPGVAISQLIGTDLGAAGGAPPTVGFSESATSGTAPLSVTFTNTTTNALTYQWNFGDGGTSSAVNPTHTFTAAGNYPVSLTATGTNGSASQQQLIAVTPPSTPVTGVVNFVTDGDSITYGYPVSSDQSWPVRAQAALGSSWTLHNIAVSGSRSEQNAQAATSNLTPLYQRGQRNVLVLMVGTNDLAQYTRGENIPEHSPQDILNNIQSEVSQAQALGYEVFVGTLLDTTKGDGFDASTADRNTLNNLIRATYGARVIDWATDPILGSPHGVANNSYYFADYLHPTAPGYQVMADDAVKVLRGTATPAAPLASFSATPTSGVAPLTVQLTNSSQNASTYQWSFGDNSNSSATNSSHVFTTAGSYVVTLTATATDGRQSTAQTTITVTAPNPGNSGGVFARDSFSGTAGLALDQHVGETAHWVKTFGNSGALVLDGSGHLQGVNNDSVIYTLAETPAAPSGWDLQGDLTWSGSNQRNYIGLGWMDMATGHRLQFSYNAYYNCWSVYKNDAIVANSPAIGTLRTGQVFTVKISARAGGAVSFLVNGSAVASFTDPDVVNATKGRMNVCNYGNSGFLLGNLSGVQATP